MKTDYILSPWRIEIHDHYTVNYRLSLDNVLRAECVRWKDNYSVLFSRQRTDRELEKDGYILCSSEEQFDKYKILV